MKDVIVKGRLLDYYGSLLTERQRYCMEQYYEGDMSLAEIAESLRVSRQAVHDNLQRASDLLDMYEEKMQLLALEKQRQDIVEQIRCCVEKDHLEKEKLLHLLTLLD